MTAPRKKSAHPATTRQAPKAARGYSDERFWNKVTLYAATAGFEVIQKALWLYYAAQKPDIPAWARRSVYGALFYFINPFDLLTDVMPWLGFSDDLAVLALAVTTIALYIDDDVKEQADARIREWFKLDKPDSAHDGPNPGQVKNKGKARR